MKLILKESQIKSLIKGYKSLNEQQSGTSAGGFDPTTKEETINFKALWSSGKYKLTSTQITTMQGELLKITNFMKANPTAKLNIVIEAGESLVPNYDREKCPGKDYRPECKLETGKLSELRGQQMYNYLLKYFQTLKTNGAIQVMPNTPQTKVIQGTTPWVKGNDPNAQSYTDEQFVRLKISAEASYDCLIGMNIKVAYDTSGHTCDEAIFAVKVNGVTLGIVNLNNGDIDISTQQPKAWPIERYITNRNTSDTRFQNEWKKFKVDFNPDTVITAEMGKYYPPLRTRVGKTMGEVATTVPEGNIQQKVKAIEGRETDNAKGGKRSGTFTLTTEKAKEIVSQAPVKDRLIISLKPLVDRTGAYSVFYKRGSHSEVPSVYITGRNGDSRYSGTPNLKMTRGSMTETNILTTDLCGNPITT